jgi:hypothetical protein
MEKDYIVVIGEDRLKVDEINPEFAIQDSKASGRGEDLTMYREILGGINKFTCKLNYPYGERLNIIRKLSRTPIVTIDIYNPMEGKRRQMKVSVKCEKINTIKISGIEYAKPLDISFTQIGKDII